MGGMGKINYDAVFSEIAARESGKKVLLHCCCAPCATACLERLKGLDVTCFYYNPNIMPEEEYVKRGVELDKLCAIIGVPLIKCDYAAEEFIEAARGFESEREGGARCEKCFYLRLKKTAEFARDNGFDYFCTTLTVSPHKNSALINLIGERISAETGAAFLPSDFKKRDGYKNSVLLSEKYGLYRQNYCGCTYARESK